MFLPIYLSIEIERLYGIGSVTEAEKCQYLQKESEAGDTREPMVSFAFKTKGWRTRRVNGVSFGSKDGGLLNPGRANVLVHICRQEKANVPT